jgi:hypothetical protein
MRLTAPVRIPFVNSRRQVENPNFEYSFLPSYGKVYLNHLLGEFESLKGQSKDDCACQVGQQIADKAKAGEALTWGDTYVLERAVLLMLPDLEVHQRLWCLEARYRDAVGNSTAYDSFMKVEASHLAPESIEHARARLDNLIRELYRLYTVIDCREHMRRHLSKTASIALGVICALSLSIAGGFTFTRYSWPVPFAIVFAAGAIGGAVSFQRRLQSLPSRGETLGDLVELESGSGMYFSPVAGGVFAIVLYIFFAAGLAGGEIFPKIADSPISSGTFSEFASRIRPSMIADWGKLLVWSFIAGFAERFVPDTLDRLITRSDEKKKQSG